jgi:hypothetical protein
MHIEPTATVLDAAQPLGPATRRASPELVCHTHDTPQRRRAEAFVRTEFLEHFDARVTRFMPTLLELHDGRGAIRGVVGCRSAAHEPLFLETYTRMPIEQLILQRLEVQVPRTEIVEIGSLACRDARAAIDVVKVIVPLLLDAGFSWVAFTGASTVMNVFRYLGLAPHVLCNADRALLAADGDDWGTYYDHDPRVMTGRLRDGARALGIEREAL